MTDRETLDVYAAKAGEYADLVKDAGDDPMVQRFVANVPSGAPVLDIGCGPGFAAAAMARAGLEAHAWDPVPEMLDIVRGHAGVTARQAGYDDLDGEGIYAGIWANFSMLHAPLAKWRPIRALRDTSPCRSCDQSNYFETLLVASAFENDA